MPNASSTRETERRVSHSCGRAGARDNVEGLKELYVLLHCVDMCTFESAQVSKTITNNNRAAGWELHGYVLLAESTHGLYVTAIMTHTAT